MWNDDDFTRSGGGFDVSGYDSPSASTAEVKTSKRPSSVFPVAIKQILENTDDVMQISGLPVTMMTVVGIVKSIEYSTTKIQYTVQDWSGEIRGMLWLEGDSNDKPSGVIENTYCRMSGTKRMQDSKPCLFIYNISSIEDMNEITYHYLQVIYIPLKADELKQMNQDKLDNGSYMETKSSTISNESDNMNFPPQHLKVYRIIQQAKSEAGMNKNEVLQFFKMPLAELDKIIEYLITEGHIYATVDDDHYKATDS